MSVLAAKIIAWADPLEVFRARCIARHTLVASGDLDLHEAVDGLQAAAVRTGLVHELGQDQVQAIMAYPDVDVVRGVPAGDHLDQACDVASLKRRPIPKSTIDAAEYLVRQGDPARLRKWLDGRPAAERAAIHKHLNEVK
jgi:hypothetical protein